MALPPAVAQYPYPPPPPSAPPSELLHSPPTTAGTSASYSSREAGAVRPPGVALALGPDMAGGDSRVADGRESSAGSSGRETTATPEDHQTPKDPHMFLAPSQRPPSSAASSAAMELRAAGAGLGVPRGETGGGGLQRGPGVGAPLSMDSVDTATSRF